MFLVRILSLTFCVAVCSVNQNGWTALVEAARVGSEQLVALLIDAGADIHKYNVFGWTPLIAACRNGHYNVVEMLILQGADVRHTDHDGESAEDHANDSSIVALLKEASTRGV